MKTALALLLLACPQEDPKLVKARKAMELSATSAAQSLAKLVKDERVACLDLRPSIENPAAAANCPTLQDWLIQAFLKEGVLVFPLEKERKLDVVYKKGKLSRDLPLKADDLKALAGRKVRFAIFPQIVPKDGSAAVTIDLFDLEKGGLALQLGVGPLPTKSWPLAALCAQSLLPPLNAKVLAFAAANFDRQVDRGECWDLGANPVRAGGGSVDGYKFGREVKWEDARPGDIVTFGTSGSTGGHVVVLFRWTTNRTAATILHQNSGGVRRVMFGNLGEVESHKTGQVFAVWRP